MKKLSQYSPADICKIQKIKSDIQHLRQELSEIDRELGGIKKDDTNFESNKPIANYSPELLQHNEDSKNESTEQDKEKSWGNYILVIFIVFYFVVMSFI